MYLKNAILPLCKNTLPKGIFKKMLNATNITKKGFLARNSNLGGLHHYIDPKPRKFPQKSFFCVFGRVDDPRTHMTLTLFVQTLHIMSIVYNNYYTTSIAPLT